MPVHWMSGVIPCHGRTHLPCFAAGQQHASYVCVALVMTALSAKTGRGAGFTLTALAAGRLLGGALWRITTPDGEDIIYAVRDGSVMLPIAIMSSVCPTWFHALQVCIAGSSCTHKNASADSSPCTPGRCTTTTAASATWQRPRWRARARARRC